VTWLDLSDDTRYGVDNLPFGVFSTAGEGPRVGVRVGDQVVDLAPLAATDALEGAELFAQPTLNPFMATGKATWTAARSWLTDLLTQPTNADVVAPHLLPLDSVTLHLPFAVADYVDFYASESHATNVGHIFRPDGNALTPNWKHLPIGYHGRSGTVVVSGTDVVRPTGQRKAPSDAAPTFGPSVRLDIEAEVGFVVGAPSTMSHRVGVDDFDEHVFGMVLLNDWSARDIQAWEYVPLGPFLGKSFATSVSAWVTPLAALAAARCDLPAQDPVPLPYLAGGDALDIEVEVVLNGEVVSRPPYRTMYWSPAQMLAHLTVNGASTRTGDLFASGTISGPEPDTRGSFLELSWGGKEPFAGGHTFLEDGDEVTLRYAAPGTGGGRITLGEVTGRIEAARV